MNNIYSKWDDEEIKTLFKFIQIKKEDGVTLINAFKEYANKTFRRQNSVRNYYYKELGNLEKDKDRCDALGIDLSVHSVNQILPFTDTEKNKVVEDINNLVSNGYSVRKACLTLANGDVSKMIRFQNKYRAVMSNNENNTNNCTIYKMPVKNSSMTNEDITALFMGLVKLVKKQEHENALASAQIEIESANFKLKKAITDIVARDNEITKLRSKICALNMQVRGLKNKAIKTRSEFASLVASNGKDAKKILKRYFNKPSAKEYRNLVQDVKKG